MLGLYSNIAISWMAAVVADLVINKPLGLSPPGIEFKRSHLYDINPVGVGAMGIASLLSICRLQRLFGDARCALRLVHRPARAFVASPLIAWGTGGRYYLVRRKVPRRRRQKRCCICEREYEGDDTAHCPAYGGTICSLCCSLDARCDDLCKPGANLDGAMERPAAPPAAGGRPALSGNRAGHYLLLMTASCRCSPDCSACCTPTKCWPCADANRADSAVARQVHQDLRRRCCCFPASAPGGWC
jgi:hypothetical protein